MRRFGQGALSCCQPYDSVPKSVYMQFEGSNYVPGIAFMLSWTLTYYSGVKLSFISFVSRLSQICGNVKVFDACSNQTHAFVSHEIYIFHETESNF